jgi:peroxiredoxin
MKKLILIAVFGLIGLFGFSQTLSADQVPQLIKDRVQFKFPQSMDVPVAWSREKGDYKAQLTIMDTPAFIVVDSLGKIKRVERRMHETYMPEKAKKYLKSLDSDYQVVTMMMVTDENEKVTYKTVARVKTDFVFDGKGNIVSKK